MRPRENRPAPVRAGQLDLFAPASTERSRDPTTTAPLCARSSPSSRAAGRYMRRRAGKLEAPVLHFSIARDPGGATDAQQQKRTGLDGSTQRPRRVRLVEIGLVVDSGRGRTTASGRLATVWVAVEAMH